MDLYNLKAYKVLQEKYIKDVDSKAFILEHIKTKAKVVVMANDDNNKTFSIAFRTPPADDTGVPHIIEHSVLCGSTKFPSKEPFVELMKASLNTFLNAMTYPDKTVYPVSSCNDKDFQNLMDVYLDAVFHPNMYINEKIFMQEGWHYELEKPEDSITYNGVVYNEMQGAFSSPEQVLMREILHVMYKDNCYTYESGGNPEFIPNLTYQGFLDFHSKYYHPSNSYIYLYGNCDFEEKLKWIDEEYLSKYDAKIIDSEINKQSNFKEMIKHYVQYPVGHDETLNEKTYISKNYLIGEANDSLLWLSLTILSYILFSAPGAVVKQALLDAGIGKKISSSYDSGLIQPLFTIYASGTDKEREDEFNEIIDKTLRKCVEEGIDKKQINAAINVFEFKYREADFGRDPKGLIYGLNILDTWLYDEDPFIRLEVEDLFTQIKELVKGDYFESLVTKYFLENGNCGNVVVYPSNELGKEKEEQKQNKLKEFKESLSNEEINKIINNTKELKEYQEAPSKKEDLDKIPYLTREDLKTELEKTSNIVSYEDGVKLIHHNHFTNGIGYLKLMFNTNNLDEEYLPYVGLLCYVLSKVNTKNYTYSQIDTEINLNCGDITFDTYSVSKDDCDLYLSCLSSVLYEKIDFSFNMILEIINNSIFNDKKRMKEILFELKDRKEKSITSRGHVYSYTKALSYVNKGAKISDLLSGVDFYKVLESITKNFDEKFDDLVNRLNTLVKYIFRKENLFISYTANEEGFELMRKEVSSFTNALNKDENIELKHYDFKPCVLNEGIKTSSNVQYVSRAGNFVQHGYKFTGAVIVLKNILDTEYLWVKGRVLGGAYGCMCTFNRNGNTAFMSYRDPNLKETNKIYDDILTFLKEFNATEDEITKFIIGSVGGVVIPRTPRMLGDYDLYNYLYEISDETRQNELNEIINCNCKQIKELYDLVKSVLDDNALCVIGNENKIEEQKDLFKKIYTLIE